MEPLYVLCSSDDGPDKKLPHPISQEELESGVQPSNDGMSPPSNRTGFRRDTTTTAHRRAPRQSNGGICTARLVGAVSDPVPSLMTHWREEIANTCGSACHATRESPGLVGFVGEFATFGILRRLGPARRGGVRSTVRPPGSPCPATLLTRLEAHGGRGDLHRGACLSRAVLPGSGRLHCAGA